MSAIQALYEIRGFRSELNVEMSGHGFCIALSSVVVDRVLKAQKRNDNAPLFRMMTQNIQKSFTYASVSAPIVDFYKDTWLLWGLTVPGNCACFGISGSQREKLDEKPIDLLYAPHNIDTLQQSAALLSTWLMWFNHIVAITDIETPHATYH